MRDRRCESDRWRILIKREAHLEAVFTPTASSQERESESERERDEIERESSPYVSWPDR